MTLESAEISESVQVVAEAQLVDTSGATLGQVALLTGIRCISKWTID